MVKLAFLTTEYPTEVQGGGGLAAYLGRMTRLLADAGHAPEVFTLSQHAEGTVRDGSVLVHRVNASRRSPHHLVELGAIAPSLVGTRRTATRLRVAHALAQALHRREAEVAFAAVQSANFNLSGFYVEPRAGRPHVVRCSQSTRDCTVADRSRTYLDDRVTERLEVDYLRRASTVYAPALRTVRVYEQFGIRMRCVRPPVVTETEETAPSNAASLPPRFFFHFGKFSRLKGTDLVARAVVRAWRHEPGIRLILAGAGSPRPILQRYGCANDNRVLWLGALAKSEVNYVLRRAIATLSPSRVDNLPNTVIESLSAGIRVIGSRGASIDELVEHERSGILIPMEDTDALADAMIRAHRGDGWWQEPFVRPAVLDEMAPERAVAHLLEVFGLHARG